MYILLLLLHIIRYREIKANLRCVELKKGDNDYDEHYGKTKD